MIKKYIIGAAVAVVAVVCTFAFLSGEAQAMPCCEHGNIKDATKAQAGTKCTFCNGTGWRSGSNFKCSACSGTGTNNEY